MCRAKRDPENGSDAKLASRFGSQGVHVEGRGFSRNVAAVFFVQ